MLAELTLVFQGHVRMHCCLILDNQSLCQDESCIFGQNTTFGLLLNNTEHIIICAIVLTNFVLELTKSNLWPPLFCPTAALYCIQLFKPEVAYYNHFLWNCFILQQLSFMEFSMPQFCYFQWWVKSDHLSLWIAPWVIWGNTFLP